VKDAVGKPSRRLPALWRTTDVRPPRRLWMCQTDELSRKPPASQPVIASGTRASSAHAHSCPEPPGAHPGDKLRAIRWTGWHWADTGVDDSSGHSTGRNGLDVREPSPAAVRSSGDMGDTVSFHSARSVTTPGPPSDPTAGSARWLVRAASDTKRSASPNGHRCLRRCQTEAHELDGTPRGGRLAGLTPGQRTRTHWLDASGQPLELCVAGSSPAPRARKRLVRWHVRAFAV
jgi:hypothetical protein